MSSLIDKNTSKVSNAFFAVSTLEVSSISGRSFCVNLLTKKLQPKHIDMPFNFAQDLLGDGAVSCFSWV
jgi:hypothetical protein